MVFEKLFKKKGDIGTTDYIEVDSESMESSAGKMSIRVETLNDFNDTERIQKYLREGSIILLKIKKLRDRDLGELKRSVEKLRRTAGAINGDIAGVEEDWLIVCPQYAKVHRG